MNILKAEPLESRRAVLDRFLFRLLWCSVGAAGAFAILANVRDQIWFLIVSIIAVSSLGAIVDSYRLKNPQVSVLRLYILLAVVISLALWAYVFVVGGMR